MRCGKRGSGLHNLSWNRERASSVNTTDFALPTVDTRSFVNRLLRLTLLAPGILEAILEGRQPKGMQLEELTRAMLSGWAEQRESVGHRPVRMKHERPPW